MKLFITTDGCGHVEVGLRFIRGWDGMTLSPEETHTLIIKLARAYHEVTGSLPPPVSRKDIELPRPFVATAKAFRKKTRK